MHNFLDDIVFPDEVSHVLGDVKLDKADALITKLGNAIDEFPPSRDEGVEKWQTGWSYLQVPEGVPLSAVDDYIKMTLDEHGHQLTQLHKKDFKHAFIELYDSIAECYMRLEDGGVEPLACEKKALIILEELINLMEWPIDSLHVWPKVSRDDQPYTTWTPQTSAWDEAYNVDLIPTDVIWGEPTDESE
jgi:hypothetical protein